MLKIERITKTYAGAIAPTLTNIDIEVADGEFLVLVGPSGCGKSTLLKIIAGLEDATSGDLIMNGRSMIGLEPRQRDFAMVFQSYALYPHLTVRGNLRYPLKLAGLHKAEIAQRVDEIAQILQLGEFLDRRPSELSGGQRQRVAMGRALVRRPQVFLMDEPLSNLDAKLRVQMRAEISRIQREVGVTTIYVTHDQVEAMTMGTRVAVMHEGRIQQIDTPRALYERPANSFVAGNIGSPAMNLLPARATADEPERVRICSQSLRIPPGADLREGRVVVGIRPEALDVSALERGESCLAATVNDVEDLGAEWIVHAEVRGSDNDESSGHPVVVVARLREPCPVPVGGAAYLSVRPADMHLFDAESGLTLRADAAPPALI